MILMVKELITINWMIMNGLFLSILFFTLIFSKNLGESARKKLGWGLGALSLLNFAASNIKMVIENSWHIENSLPLHLCGMSAFIAAFLLIRGSQISYEFLVYWGAGAIHAFLTPEITNGSSLYNHIEYSISHGIIILGSVYATMRLGYTPRPGSWWKVFLYTQLTIPIIGGANYLTGGNYMYLCQKPTADNPFVKATTHRGQALEPKSVRTETWATGLRNAWRFSFDPKTGACFTGDVGQNLYEEIDILVSGGDYGWSEVEADHIFNKKDASAKQGPAKPAAASAYVAPIYEYDRKLGGSVTGGVVCRSERIPAIRDAYVFGDYASGRLFAIKEKDGKWTGEVIAKDMTIAGFGHDPVNGDVLFVTLSGQLKRLAPKK